MSNSDSSPEKNGLKSLLAKGVVSAVALAGTTAIPIVVQRSLQPSPTPVASPTATVPVSPTPAVVSSEQGSPLPDSPQLRSTEITNQAIGQDENDDRPRGKGKKKKND